MDCPEIERLLERLAENEFAIRHLGGRGAAALFQRDLDHDLWILEKKLGPEEARRRFDLAIEKKRLQDASRRALYEMHRFARELDVGAIWQGLWSGRDLERILLLFTEDGRYQNPDLEIDVRGRPALRRALGFVLHACDARVCVDRWRIEDNAMLLNWTRCATRVPEKWMPRKDFFRFEGSSRLQVRCTKIQSCEEHWDMRPLLESITSVPRYN